MTEEIVDRQIKVSLPLYKWELVLSVLLDKAVFHHHLFPELLASEISEQIKGKEVKR